MKKLFVILFVLAFATTISFAQANSSTVDQAGSNQTATVTQTGATNISDVDQFTNNNGPQTAEILQTGTDNWSYASQAQTGGGGTTPNTVYLEQLGTENSSTQLENAPGYNSGQHQTGYQDGFSNLLFQEITGGYTMSQWSSQTGEENEVFQLSGAAYEFSKATQSGDFNFASQIAGGTKADFVIEQYGLSNEAYQEASGSFGFTPTNKGLIVQDGEDNYGSQVIISASSQSNDSQLFQTGDLNSSWQTQTGNGHLSTVNQVGSGHGSIVTQSN